MVKIKVCIFGIYYPLAMLSYFREAFEQRNDIELYTCGPFTSDWIPWANGIKLPIKYVHPPTVALPQQSIGISPSYNLVKSMLPNNLDLALCIDAGWHFSDRPKAKVVALVKTDPHAIPDIHYSVPANYSNVVFNMQDFYRDGNEILLPYAYSPRIHFHEDREKIYDACLIGLHYEHRNALIKRLRDRGLNVYYSIGEIYSEYRQKYNESKIALSWSSKYDLPARFFEGLAMQLPVVSNIVPDQKLLGFCSEEHFLGFTTIDEAENQVMRLLNDKELLDKIAISGYNRVKEHTWDARAQKILEECKLL